MARMQMRLIDDIEAFGRESFVQLFRDSLPGAVFCGAHGQPDYVD
jgi:hypothetical protein